MKIKTNERCKTVDNVPVKPGTIVDVDSNTARNLINKGFAEAADSEANKLNLKRRSRLTAPQARASVEKIIDLRAKAKAAEDEERRELAAAG